MVVENLLPSSEGGEEGDLARGPQSLNTITLQLEENLKEEQRFNCRMLYTVFKLGLNPVQVSLTAWECCACSANTQGWLLFKVLSLPLHSLQGKLCLCISVLTGYSLGW